MSANLVRPLELWRPALLIALLAIVACSRSPAHPAMESGRLPATWYAGTANCAGTPPFRVHAYNSDLYILRQAACTNFEKPFLYLLFGRNRALLLDTGAGNVDVASPVDTLVRAWLARNHRTSVDLIVAHSHSHGDHVAGDRQFADRPGTAVVGLDTQSVRSFFQVARWPEDAGIIDLGDRVIDVLPIPGHEAASIALYDRRTALLLTGDTFYPGRLYVRDTAAFARSIARLATFARANPVLHILGAHVEQTRTAFRDYPQGTVDQPEEHPLDLGRDRLMALDSALQNMRGRFARTRMRDFTLWPLP